MIRSNTFASSSTLKLPSYPRTTPSSSCPLPSTRPYAHQLSTAAAASAAALASKPAPPTSSIHPAEIDHFTRLSSTWWDPNGELSLLHKMNKGRIAFLKQKVIEAQSWDRAREERRAKAKAKVGQSSTLPVKRRREREVQGRKLEREWAKGLRVLDVGCGGGLLSESLARLGATVHGIDATATNISIAQQHASLDPFFSSTTSSSSSSSTSTPRLTYTHTPAESLLPSQAESYDLVASVEVLEHVSSPSAFLRSLSSLLKPGGHLLLSTISRTPLARFLTITLAEEVLGLVSKGTHSFSKFVKRDELVEFIASEKAGGGGGGLGWYPAFPCTQSVQQEAISIPARLQLETRGIIYDPIIADWRLLDRAGWIQRSGWGEECNYLLWARKPFV